MKAQDFINHLYDEEDNEDMDRSLDMGSIHEPGKPDVSLLPRQNSGLSRSSHGMGFSRRNSQKGDTSSLLNGKTPRRGSIKGAPPRRGLLARTPSVRLGELVRTASSRMLDGRQKVRRAKSLDGCDGLLDLCDAFMDAKKENDMTLRRPSLSSTESVNDDEDEPQIKENDIPVEGSRPSTTTRRKEEEEPSRDERRRVRHLPKDPPARRSAPSREKSIRRSTSSDRLAASSDRSLLTTDSSDIRRSSSHRSSSRAASNDANESDMDHSIRRSSNHSLRRKPSLQRKPSDPKSRTTLSRAASGDALRRPTRGTVRRSNSSDGLRRHASNDSLRRSSHEKRPEPRRGVSRSKSSLHRQHSIEAHNNKGDDFFDKPMSRTEHTARKSRTRVCAAQSA